MTAVNVPMDDWVAGGDGKVRGSDPEGNEGTQDETILANILYSNNFESESSGTVTTTTNLNLLSVNSASLQAFDDSKSVSGTSQSIRDDLITTARECYGWRLDFSDYGEEIRISEGDEVWVRFAMFFETGFDFTIAEGPENAPSVKWLAFEDDTVSGRTYINPMAESGPATDWYYDAEGVSSDDVSDITGGTGNILRNVWQTWEVRLKMSKIGDGEVDLWRDGVKVASLTNLTNIHSSGSYFYKFNMGKYWNEEPTQEQSMWWDNHAVAVKTSGANGGDARDDTAHMALDPSGNPFIGEAIQA